MNKAFKERLQLLESSYNSLIERRNVKQPPGNGIFDRYIYPILTKEHINYNRDWWVQAEAVVGYLNAFEVTGNEKFLDNSVSCWKYIKENLIDHENGEWFWGIKKGDSGLPSASYINSSISSISISGCYSRH